MFKIVNGYEDVPSLPLSLLLYLPPSPSLPSYRVGGDKEPAHKLRFAENPAPSFSLSLPPPSLLYRTRQRTRPHTKVERRPRAEETPWNGNETVVLPKALCLWHKLVGQPVCTQTCWPACMYTNLLASLYVHKLVGQPVCSQTYWSACMYTNLLASLYVHTTIHLGPGHLFTGESLFGHVQSVL